MSSNPGSLISGLRRRHERRRAAFGAQREREREVEEVVARDPDAKRARVLLTRGALDEREEARVGVGLGRVAFLCRDGEVLVFVRGFAAAEFLGRVDGVVVHSGRVVPEDFGAVDAAPAEGGVREGVDGVPVELVGDKGVEAAELHDLRQAGPEAERVGQEEERLRGRGPEAAGPVADAVVDLAHQ